MNYRLFAAASACLMLCACASVTRGTNDAWEVNSEPSGAKVTTTNGHYCEATPCAIKMKRKSEFIATVTKPGYKPATISVTHKTAGAGAAGMAGNVLLGGVIGVGVDAVTGATQDLVPNPAFVKLEAEGATTTAASAPTTPGSTSDLEWAKVVGKNTVKGSALLRTRGGEVRTCAGLQARIFPSGEVTDAFARKTFGSISGGMRRSTSWSAQPFDEFSQVTTCNAQGEFEFTGLPDGRYYVTAVVSWEAVAGTYTSYMEQQGGTLAIAVTVAGGETKSIVVTQ